MGFFNESTFIGKTEWTANAKIGIAIAIVAVIVFFLFV